MGKRGPCHLCGEVGKRTEDHIQPQCAFNEQSREYIRLDSKLNQSMQQRAAPHGKPWRTYYYEIQPDKPIGGGIYRYTQCGECNGLLGRNYDQRFGVFCRDAVANMKLGKIVVVKRSYPQTCRYPLSVLKRIIAMFMSINGEKFHEAQPELAHFVRNPEVRGLSPKYRVFVGYNANDLVSHIPFQFRTNIRFDITHSISQISHPPLVYLLSLESPVLDDGATEITHFADYAYDDEANLELRFKILPTNNFFAGDFRREGKLVPDEVAILPGAEPSFFRLVDPVI